MAGRRALVPQLSGTRTAGRVLTAVVLLVVTGVLLVLLAPDRVGLAGRAPVAQVVALRGLLAVVLLLGAVAAAGTAAALVRIGRRADVPGHRGVRTAVAVAVLLAVGAGAQGAVLAGRGFGPGPGPAPGVPGDPGDADLVVVAFNTLDVVDADALADLALAQQADVVVLPETSARTARAAAAALTAAGQPTTSLAAPNTGHTTEGTALLWADHLGEPERLDAAVPAPELGSFAVTAADADGAAPSLLAALHLRAPSGGGAMATWREHTADAAALCAATPGAVVAGDLNATLDHPGLGDLGPCVDAAAAVGAAGLGTWPADVPRVLGAPIDHVLVDARTWDVTGYAVLPRVGGSDHRPVVAHLVRR